MSQDNQPLEVIHQDFFTRDDDDTHYYRSRRQEPQIKQLYCQYLKKDQPLYTEKNLALSRKVFEGHQDELSRQYPGYRICLWPSFPVAETWMRPQKIIFIHPEHWSQPIIVYDQYGLRSGPIDPSKKLVILFGDSVMQGLMIKHWIDILNESLTGEYQVLNAALSGANLGHILQLIKFITESPLKSQIARMIIFPGWHSIYNTGEFRSLLTQCLDAAINPILVTIPLSVKEEYQDRNMVGAFLDRSQRYGGWWGLFPDNTHVARYFLRLIRKINGIIREMANGGGEGRWGNIPVIDLHERINERMNWENFHQYFFDLGHPDPAAYPELAEIFQEELAKINIV